MRHLAHMGLSQEIFPASVLSDDHSIRMMERGNETQIWA